uniref:Odorant-binding protein 8 n=1 Tax=Dastarcus helophoroides TaxID=1169899 RepID=A0A1I9HZN8_9CUCU|nr:odorant-binding protein 8 [Dastarcus helophoroides]
MARTMYVFFFLAFAAVSWVASMEATDEEMQFFKECAEENGIEYKDMRDYSFKDVPEELHCYIKCFAEKGGYLDDNGKFNIEKARARDHGNGEEALEKAYQCLENLSPVKSCSDMEPALKCVEDVDHFFAK